MDQQGDQFAAPPSERRAWATAAALACAGIAVLALIATGTIGRTGAPTGGMAPPAVPSVAPTPVPTQPVSDVTGAGAAPRTKPAVLDGRAAPVRGASIVGQPPAARQRADLALFQAPTETHIAARWMSGFYPIYAQAQRTFGVNWLLIASIHRQETAFSTNPTTYRGLNFAHCCGGPMQFNVTNGPVTTWSLVSNSYEYGRRPSAYDHMTARHPSIYDDFDAIMAAAHLLSADGAGMALDASAWGAAYDYYGHDLTGVTYADQVLARAIGWSQHGFCINCGVETAMVQAVHSAYGASVQAGLQAPAALSARAEPAARARRAGGRRPGRRG